MGRYLNQLKTCSQFAEFEIVAPTISTLFILEFIININLPNINEYVRPDLSPSLVDGVPFSLSDAERELRIYNALKSNKGILCQLFINDGQISHLIHSWLVWNKPPGYNEDVLKDIKSQMEQLVIAQGNKLIIKLLPWNNTVMGVGDAITVNLTCYEEISN